MKTLHQARPSAIVVVALEQCLMSYSTTY